MNAITPLKQIDDLAREARSMPQLLPSRMPEVEKDYSRLLGIPDSPCGLGSATGYKRSPGAGGLFSPILSLREELTQTRAMLDEYEALANVGQMAHHIAHDLRHYLSAIYANVELMASPRSNREGRAEMAADVREAIKDMTDMLDSVLPSGRNGQGCSDGTASLSSVIQRAAKMVSFHPQGKNVELLLGYIPPFEGQLQRVALGRAVYNLLLNACQATRETNAPGRVIVRTSADAVSATIRVIDNGPGVSGAVRETLFLRSVHRKKSNGLGLLIAEDVAKAHGGFVSLEESRPGFTVFALHLSNLKARSHKLSSQFENGSVMRRQPIEVLHAALDDAYSSRG
jgi:signal transduction histidine kinase